MEKEVQKKKEPNLILITPKKDHVIHQNEFHYDLKKGIEIKVAEHFIAALKTEKVI